MISDARRREERNLATWFPQDTGSLTMHYSHWESHTHTHTHTVIITITVSPDHIESTCVSEQQVNDVERFVDVLKVSFRVSVPFS